MYFLRTYVINLSNAIVTIEVAGCILSPPALPHGNVQAIAAAYQRRIVA